MTNKRWQFGWCDEDSPPANGDDRTWKSKVFRANSFQAAMGKMLEFVRDKPFVCLVDYECAALHIPYSTSRHEEHFHRIDTTNHELRDYVS